MKGLNKNEKKVTNAAQPQTHTWPPDGTSFKYSICFPSGFTTASHIKKRARNGHQSYIKNW